MGALRFNPLFVGASVVTATPQRPVFQGVPGALSTNPHPPGGGGPTLISLKFPINLFLI